MVNFIGIGAQKSGTSWVYACLYEHPEICAPIKEIHFFSRPRYSEGKEWYEAHFKKCTVKCVGEFSTSYLYSPVAAERIHDMYPATKLIAIVRNPVKRARSQYHNAIKAGEITEAVSFESYMKSEKSVCEQGLYALQLERYFKLFPREQILVLVYEDIEQNQKLFMEKIYAFLNVDTSFVPSMLHEQINISRVPKRVIVDTMMHRIAEALRRRGLDRLVWYVRRLGIPDLVRKLNTKEKSVHNAVSSTDTELKSFFVEDTKKLSTYLGRDMVQEWHLV